MTFARLLLLGTVLLSSLAFAAADPDDDQGCKDHPDVPRFPGFVVVGCTLNDFNAYDFPVALEKVASKEGRFWRLQYQLKEGARTPSGVELVRNYENAFKKLGGKLHFKDMSDNGGFATFSMPFGKTERWLHLESWNGHMTVTLTILEVAAMEQKVEVSASEMLEALTKQGFIALYGVTFDTGKDVLQPESTPLLEEIAALLKGTASLTLSIEGHTDDVGDKKANEALSKKRAESVKRWLTAKGIAAARLSTNGFGAAKPLADNRTEEGRAKNRRVELVKK